MVFLFWLFNLLELAKLRLVLLAVRNVWPSIISFFALKKSSVRKELMLARTSATLSNQFVLVFSKT